MHKDQNKGADTLATTQGTVDQAPITEKYWKLVTLGGQKVEMAPNRWPTTTLSKAIRLV